MTIKRVLYRVAIRGMEKLFLLRGIRGLYHSNVDVSKVVSKESIDIITIAYNNAQIIALHNEYVNKYLLGNITHIVVDNSTNRTESIKIREVCEQMGVGYVRLHRNRMNIFSGSYSHATAVNWAYKHIIKPRGAWGFGIIDHDIFPVQKIDLVEKLRKQLIWGQQIKRNNLWYLSAIISFFRKEAVKGTHFDFMPITINGTYLDTGGGNWETIYKNMNESDIEFMPFKSVNFKEGNSHQQDMLDLFDNEKWVHTINGSFWKKVDGIKEGIIPELITKYEHTPTC